MDTESLAQEVCDSVWGQIPLMEDMLLKTKATGEEQAVSFCKSLNIITPTERTSGRVESVLPPECKTNWNRVGVYHTHPKATPTLSPMDYQYMIRESLPAMCVGGMSSDDGTLRFDIHCECLDADALDRSPQRDIMMGLLEKSMKASEAAQEKRKRGEGFEAQTRQYQAAIGEFRRLAEKSGCLKTCPVPQRDGDWSRVMEYL